jgi:hypothetical protein
MISWETLLEYLGPDPTASQKKAIFEAVSRIGATGATFDHNGVFMAMNLVMCQLSSEPVITLPAADDDFHGEIEFELNTGLLELMRSAKDPKTLSPLRLMKRRLFRG